MECRATEVTPPSVPERAKQGGETVLPETGVRVKPWVWTKRMATALVEGVKGGRWYSLIDKVFSLRTLREAAERVTRQKRKAAGVDHVTPERFGRRLEAEVRKLSAELRNGSYRPQAIRRVYIPKPGSREKRPLGIPTVRDRVVQAAVLDVIEPIFEAGFAEHSYGFRPGRSCKDALRRVDQLVKSGYTYVVDVDLKSYFDTIPHDRLMSLIAEKISDSRLLALIEGFLKQGVMDELREWTPESGTPQGAIISPLLSNIYLDPLDHLLASHGFEAVRYADDLVIMCRSLEEAEAALALVQRWTEEAGLKLHPTKTRIATHEEGFEFLGYRFQRAKRTGRANRYPRKKAIQKLKDAIRAKTRRTDGRSLPVIIEDVNKTLRGWFQYFKHAHWTTFEPLDKWVRRRLRSILRRRLGLRGISKGQDHQRWPNAFFAGHGLLSLKAAHAAACCSSRR